MELKPIPKIKRIRNKRLIAEYALRHPRCEKCGSTKKIGGKMNGGVHHIVYRSQGGGDDHGNLITLCSTHHTEAHEGKITNEELLEIKGHE